MSLIVFCLNYLLFVALANAFDLSIGAIALVAAMQFLTARCFIFLFGRKGLWVFAIISIQFLSIFACATYMANNMATEFYVAIFISALALTTLSLLFFKHSVSVCFLTNTMLLVYTLEILTTIPGQQIYDFANSLTLPVLAGYFAAGMFSAAKYWIFKTLRVNLTEDKNTTPNY